jgi:hypothetical protein
MTDNTTTANDLGLAPAAPAAPQMSVAEAASRKNEFFADKAKMDALMAGDISATEEWRNIVNSISAQPAAPTDPRQEATDHLQQSAGFTLHPDALAEFAQNRPVSPIERHYALSKWEELKQDADWFQRYQRGEQKALKEKALIDSILSRPIRDPQSK